MTPMVPPGSLPDPALFEFYEEEARKYQATLTLEDYMEATDHATQREITLESFAVIRETRPDIHCFNELLVQYPRRGASPGKVVPDNFVVVYPAPLGSLTSFALELQPVGPLLVLEYVSKHTERKDSEENFELYERELRVPFYLLSYRDNQELSLFRRGKTKYSSVKPNKAGRLAVPELETEAAILDDWVRFWFRDELVPLPGELVRERNAERKARLAADNARLAADNARLAADNARLAAEARVKQLEAELARLKGAS